MNIKHGKYMSWETWENFVSKYHKCPVCDQKLNCYFCLDVKRWLKENELRRTKELENVYYVQ